MDYSIHIGISFLKAPTSSCFPSLLQSNVHWSLTNYLMEILVGQLTGEQHFFQMAEGDASVHGIAVSMFPFSTYFYLFLPVSTTVFDCTKYCHYEFSRNIYKVYP